MHSPLFILGDEKTIVLPFEENENTCTNVFQQSQKFEIGHEV
jgi:hypothetical protein